MVLEIEERKHFLEQMTALGKRKEYQQIISNEIADVSILEYFMLFYCSLLLENTRNGID